MNKKITILILFALLFTSFLNVKAEESLEISSIQVPTSSIKPTTATITWETNFPSNSDVHYWSVDGSQENWNWDKIDNYTQTSHSIELKDLKAFTTYNFTVSSKRETDSAKTTSEQMFFTTTIDGGSNSLQITNILYVGNDNVYYVCQGTPVTWKTDDTSDNNSDFANFDLTSAKVINDFFYTDKNNVYFVNGFNYYCYFNRLAGADSATFQVFNSLYEKDKYNAYYNSYYHGGPAVTKINNADANTFIALSGGYAKDKNKVYYLPNNGVMAEIIMITVADTQSFEVFKEDAEYAMDKNTIYYAGEILAKQNYPITNYLLYNNLKGKIILKIEDKGEAYYISPDKKEMYFLSRPVIAFRVMREQGIGITNRDLEKIPVADSYCPNYDSNCDNAGSHNTIFANSQKGKIFLQVENNGEAWYVNPNDSKRYFLGRPTDAFNLMKKLGLGISNVNYDSLIK